MNAKSSFASFENVLKAVESTGEKGLRKVEQSKTSNFTSLSSLSKFSMEPLYQRSGKNAFYSKPWTDRCVKHSKVSFAPQGPTGQYLTSYIHVNTGLYACR